MNLSPEHFKIFSQQHINELHNLRVRLTRARRIAAEAEKDAQYYVERINAVKRDMLRYGIEVPE